MTTPRPTRPDEGRERLLRRLRERILAYKLGARCQALDCDLHRDSMRQAEADAERIRALEAELAEAKRCKHRFVTTYADGHTACMQCGEPAKPTAHPMTPPLPGASKDTR